MWTGFGTGLQWREGLKTVEGWAVFFLCNMADVYRHGVSDTAF
jgi:hypothetical protein